MEDLLNYLLTPAGIIAIIIGLAEVAKKLGINSKYIPIFDLVLGIVAGALIFSEVGTVNSVVLGIALGLSACGLFSGIKNLTEVYKDGD